MACDSAQYAAEGIEELEFAQKLGLKAALIPGSVRRPIQAVAENILKILICVVMLTG